MAVTAVDISTVALQRGAAHAGRLGTDIAEHHPSDLQTTMPRPPDPDLFFTGDDIAARLESKEWAVITNATPGRTTTDPAGNTVTIHDTVLRANQLANQQYPHQVDDANGALAWPRSADPTLPR